MAPSPAAEPIRIAIVGTGNIARVHARALAAAGQEAAAGQGAAAGPAATIVAAMDVDDSRLDPFRAEFGIPGGYRDLAGLLSRARPDLVHICTPPAAHHHTTLACLRAGASVRVEKSPVSQPRSARRPARSPPRPVPC